MKKKILGTVRHIILIVYSLICLVPFVWVLLSSFKDNTQIFTAPFALPANPTFENFTKAWVTGEIGSFFLNSLIVSAASVVLQLLVVSMATYAVTRVMRMKKVMGYFMIGLMVPIQAMLVPNFLIIRNMGLSNHLLSVILVYCAINIPFGVFVLSGFMEGVPLDLDEAALIDGAGHWKIFLKVIFPVCKPGLATIATFAFLNSWNEFQFASVVLTKKESMVITEGINFLKGQYVTDYGLLCAGLLFTIVPIVIIYVVLQEQVVKGMTAGAVKG